MRGAHLGPYCYPIAIDLLARGLVTSKGIVTHDYTFEQWDEAIKRRRLARFDQGSDEAGAVEHGALRTTSSASISAPRAPRRCSATRAGASSRSASGYHPDTPQPLWAEQWPQVWLDAVHRMHRRLRRRRRGQRSRIRSRRRARHLHQQPLWRLGHSRRRRDAAAASLPDLDGPPCAGRGRLGARQRRPGAPARRSPATASTAITDSPRCCGCATSSPRSPSQDALSVAAECVRDPRADRRDRGRPVLGRQYRRRLRPRARHVVHRDARRARHSGVDDAGAAGCLQRRRRRA